MKKSRNIHMEIGTAKNQGNQMGSQTNVSPGSVVGSAKLSSSQPPSAKSGIPNALDFKNVNDQLSNITRRLKLLEERLIALKSKSSMLEENEMTEKKHTEKEIKDLGTQIKDVKLSVNQIRDDVLLIIKELQTLAKKDKVDMLEKYIEIWSPINYVSQNEVVKLVKDAVEDSLKDMAMKTQQEKFIESLIDKKLQERGM
jgi:SMC interacting uncharacterized protein involved in chromosome segregation